MTDYCIIKVKLSLSPPLSRKWFKYGDWPELWKKETIFAGDD